MFAYQLGTAQEQALQRSYLRYPVGRLRTPPAPAQLLMKELILDSRNTVLLERPSARLNSKRV